MRFTIILTNRIISGSIQSFCDPWEKIEIYMERVQAKLWRNKQSSNFSLTSRDVLLKIFFCLTSVRFYRTYFNKIGPTINEDLDLEEILLSALRERQGKIHVSWADCLKDGKGRKAMDGGLVEKKKAW